jgi:hypothetical protein
VTTLDLRPKTCPESIFCGQLDPVLCGERARQRGARDEPQLDESFAERVSRRSLFLEGAVELVLAEEALLDKEPAERPPRDVGRFHQMLIGTRPGEINSSRAAKRQNGSTEPVWRARESTREPFLPATSGL